MCGGEIEIGVGDLAMYDALSQWHYRAGRPATCVQVLVARARAGGGGRTDRRGCIGVLVVSMPALNGPWRERVWPGRYVPLARTRACRRACARALNAEVRVISRLVVEPRWRGRGVGRALVEAYLRTPLSVHTEAVSAMGRYCGVFAAAGMFEVECTPARRVVRLRARLRDMGIEPWRLSDPAGLLRRCTPGQCEALERALRSFATGHRDTRARAGEPLRELMVIAARRIACRPRAYVWSTDWASVAKGVA